MLSFFYPKQVIFSKIYEIFTEIIEKRTFL